MLKRILILLLLLTAPLLPGAVLDRRTVVVAADSPLVTERRAAEILAGTLGKIFGAEIPVVAAKEFTGQTPAVILKPAALASEQWCIEAVSPQTVVISGGRTLGVLYGVYEFLEQFGHCRYFAPGCLLIPPAGSLTVPEGKKFQRQPVFKRRYANQIRDRENAAFNSWNKLNAGFCALDEDHIPLAEEYFYKTERQLGGNSHSFYRWSKDFPADHPEYFSLDANGKRLRAVGSMGPGQLCLSHPEVRKLLKAKVLAAVREDREKAAEYGYPPAAVVNITHNDNGSCCVCPGCLALQRKYGAYSGVLLDFINDIAAAAPEVQFETFAYTFTEEPPRNIKPAPNVSMYMAFLGPELMNGKCDTLRPLADHPNNAVTRRYIREWGQLCKSLTIWLYQRQFRQEFPAPNAMLWNIGKDFRFLLQSGVNRILVESEYDDLDGEIGPRAFHALHEYLVRKLLDDPMRDEQVLIREFMEYYYGPAAPEMTEYLHYLQRRMAEEPGMLGKVAEHNRAYMDTDFLVTINGLLTRAQAKVSGDSARRDRVAMELMLVDFAAANMWERLSDLPAKYGLSREALLDRLERNGLTAQQVIWGGAGQEKNLAAARRRLREKVRLLRHRPPVPAELRNRRLIQHPVLAFASGTAVDDPEAAGGKALSVGPDAPHDKPLEFGIYTRYNQKHLVRWVIPPAKIAKDEKYHLYYLGASVLPGPETQPAFWGHWSWRLRLNTSLAAAYTPQDSARMFDVYVSLKCLGPAYCPGSVRPNELRLDQVFYAERGDDNALPPEMSGRTAVVLPLHRYPRSQGFAFTADPAAAGGQALVIPRDGKPLEFGFYDRTARRKTFQRDFPEAVFTADGRYHLYSCGTPALPAADAKFACWGHWTWKLRLTDAAADFLAGHDGKRPWELFLSVRADAANLYLDRLIFALPAGMTE